jgi:TPR repeat protein
MKLRYLLIVVSFISLSAYSSAAKDNGYIEQLRAKATDGDTEAERTLADYYRLGALGVPKDIPEAIKWFQTAADNDDSEAQFRLGDLYERGELIKRNYAEAKQWFLLAAARDNAAAELMLGMMYMNGEGVSKNYHQSAYWFQKSAKHGHPSGAFMVGLMYKNGDGGLPKDNIEAYKFIFIGVSHGVDSGRRDLAELTKKMTAEEIKEAKERTEEWFKTRNQCRCFKISNN